MSATSPAAPSAAPSDTPPDTMADAILWHAGTGVFFDPAITPADAIPTGCVAVTRARHAALVDARSTGSALVAGADGLPRVQVRRTPIATLRAIARSDIRAEAGRRIRAIAGVERQSNDNAAIAVAALTGTTDAAVTAALARRRAIDAVRAASNAADAIIATMPASNLADFDATAARWWPVDGGAA